MIRVEVLDDLQVTEHSTGVPVVMSSANPEREDSVKSPDR